MDKLRGLEEEKLELESRKTGIDTVLDKEIYIHEELSILQDEYENISKSFFTSLNQADIINLLGEMLNDDAFEAEDLIFYEPQEEEVGQLSVRSIDVDIPYNGYFDGIVRVLRGISSYPKKIIINKMIMDSMEDKLAGTLSLRFCSIEEPIDSERKIISYYDLVGEIQENPFEPFEEYEEDLVLEEDMEGDIGTGEDGGEEVVEIYSRERV